MRLPLENLSDYVSVSLDCVTYDLKYFVDILAYFCPNCGKVVTNDLYSNSIEDEEPVISVYETVVDEEKQKIINFCKDYLDVHARPKEIVFRKELPRTLVGKVAYRVLEEEAEKEENNQ